MLPSVSESAVVASLALPPLPAATCRVLHVVNGEHFSGAERVQSHLGRCLPALGVRADFACVKPGKFTQLLHDHRGRWGRGFELPMQHRMDVRVAGRIRDLVRDQNYDLLHAHTPRTAMVTSIAAKLAGVPWVYHVHSPAARDSAKAWANRFNAWVERQSLRACAHLITVSESLRMDCVVHGVAEDRVSVVHNGVPAICPPRDHIPTPDGPWTIGMVALMRPRKGLEIVLDAVAHLAGEGCDVRLRCIGPFETEQYQTGIQSQIQRLGIGERVQQVGFTDDVPAALARLDALVLPSLFGEGLPMVVLEAMAAGLPVIASRVEGTPEAISHGVEGLLAEPRDAVSLAEQIRALISGRHDWSAMSAAARHRHGVCFSDHAMASGTAEVYRQVLQQSRGASFQHDKGDC